jgi:hypothetical protein
MYERVDYNFHNPFLNYLFDLFPFILGYDQCFLIILGTTFVLLNHSATVAAKLRAEATIVAGRHSLSPARAQS